MKEKKPLNKNAWFAIGSSIAFVVITLVLLILNLRTSGPNYNTPGGNGTVIVGAVMNGSSSMSGGIGTIVPRHNVLSQIAIMSIVSFVFSIITLGVSILGLFFSAGPARDGIFSAVFILHFFAGILSYSVIGVLLIIIACVFDSLYEGLSRKAAKAEKELEE